MAAPSKDKPDKQEKLYGTATALKRNLRIAYPAGKGRIILRTEMDWDKDIEPISVSEDGTLTTFHIEANQPFLYFKPCLITDDGLYHWSVGRNKLLLMEEDDKHISHPFFFAAVRGSFSELYEFPSKILGRTHYLRAYLPAGYNENTLAFYAVDLCKTDKIFFFLMKLLWGTRGRG